MSKNKNDYFGLKIDPKKVSEVSRSIGEVVGGNIYLIKSPLDMSSVELGRLEQFLKDKGEKYFVDNNKQAALKDIEQQKKLVLSKEGIVEVINIAGDQIQGVLNRGENLDTLIEEAEASKKQTQEFQRIAESQKSPGVLGTIWRAIKMFGSWLATPFKAFGSWVASKFSASEAEIKPVTHNLALDTSQQQSQTTNITPGVSSPSDRTTKQFTSEQLEQSRMHDGAETQTTANPSAQDQMRDKYGIPKNDSGKGKTGGVMGGLNQLNNRTKDTAKRTGEMANLSGSFLDSVNQLPGTSGYGKSQTLMGKEPKPGDKAAEEEKRKKEAMKQKKQK